MRWSLDRQGKKSGVENDLKEVGAVYIEAEFFLEMSAGPESMCLQYLTQF